MTATPVLIRCRDCGQKLRVPTDKLGQPGRCPLCKTPFEAVGRVERKPLSPSAWSDHFRRWLTNCCWLWLVFVLLVAAMLHWTTEAWWPNTLLLYSPRWLVLVPAAALAPFAACWSLRAVLALIAGTAAWLFLIAGLVLHWPDDGEQPAEGNLRVLTCNMQGRLAEPGRFSTLLIRTRPDVVLLQEWSGEFNEQAFGQKAWTYVQSGNLWAASRLPIKPLDSIPIDAEHLYCHAGAFEVTTDSGPIRLVNVHLPTPREGINSILASRFLDPADLKANTQGRHRASSAARQLCGSDDSLVVAGDFNLPVESSIFREHWADLHSAFSLRGCGFGWSKYTRWHGARIDHILFDSGWTCLHTHVGPDIGSDHRPVFAVLSRNY